MIKKWIKFNESSESFTEEMAQEIIYYFSEGSKPSKEIYSGFLRNDVIENEFEFEIYETSYDEMKNYVKNLLSLVQTGPIGFKDEMINIYNQIRQERKDFPEVYEIEDLYLNLIENDKFKFYLSSGMEYGIFERPEYKIELNKKHCTFNDYIRYCQSINNTIERLKSPNYKVVLSNCELSQGIRNDNTEYSYCSFKITLLK